MADRYWVGGNGTWDASSTANWSATSGGAGGASVPTSSDTVYFDANSGTGTCTLSGTQTVFQLVHQSTLLLISGTASLTVANSIYLDPTSSGWSTAGTITMTGGTGIINANGMGFGTAALVFQATVNIGSYCYASTVTHTAGTVNLAQDVGYLVCDSFSSTGSTARAISGRVNITNGNFTASGSNFDGTSAYINMQVNTVTRTFAGGGFSYQLLDVNFFSNGTLAITGNNSFGGIFDSFGSSKGTVQPATGSTNTFAVWGLSGIDSSNRTTVAPSSGTATLVVKQKLTNVDFLTFTNIVGSPVNGWYIGTGSTSSGSTNINLSFATSTTYYWVGGTGAWDFNYVQSNWVDPAIRPMISPNTANWSATSGGASASLIPVYGFDSVAFDANSASGAPFTVTALNGVSVKDFSISGLTQTMTFSTTYGSIVIGGNFTLPTSNLTWSSTIGITFSWSSGTNLLDCNGFALTNPITFSPGGGTWQLVSNFTTGAAYTTALTAGTLNLNNRTWSTGLFESNYTAVRTIAFGTGNITVTGTGTVYNVSTTTNLTISGTPVVNVTNASSSALTLSPGALTEVAAPSFNITASSGLLTISGSSNVGSLNFTGFTGTWANNTLTIYGSLTLGSGMTATGGTAARTFAATSGTKTITSNGRSMDFPITFNGTGGTWVLGDALTSGSTRTMTLTAGTLNLASYTLTTGLFSSTNSNVRAIAFGTGNITVSGTGTVWTTSSVVNLTTTGTQVVNATNSTATARTITPGLLSEATSISFNITAGTGTVTLSASQRVRSLNFTGFAGSFTIPIVTIYGSLTFSTGMTVTGSGTVDFDATSGSHTITSNGKSFGSSALRFGAAGASTATWTLGDAITTTGGLTITSGTFATGNYNVTASFLSSSNSNTRTINLGSSTVTLSIGGAAIAFSNASGMTLNAGTSQINITSTSATSIAAAASGGSSLTFYNVSFTGASFASASLAGASTFNNLTFAGRTTAGVSTVALSSDQTITGTLTLSAGTSAHYRTFVYSDVIGTARTLTCAAVASLTDIDFRDITIAGAAVSGGNLTGTRLGDCKGNSGITFPAAKTVYWNLSTGGNWGAAGSGSWALTPAGGVTNTAFPLAQDTAVFQAGGPSSGSTVTINANYNIGTINMSARTSSLITLATGTTTPAIYGNWINGTGTTLTGTGTLTFAGRGSQTITSAGKTFTQRITTDSPGGSVTLQDALNISLGSSSAFNHVSGTFDANGYNVTISGASGGVASQGSATRTLAIGSGTWTLSGTGGWNISGSGLTVTGTGTISLTSASAKTFAGGGIQTYPTLNQGGAGALTVSGSNKFSNITNTYAATGATSVLFTAGTTNIFTAFNLTGQATRVCTLDSTTTSQATLQKETAWLMGANSTNGGNNTGLSFTAGGGIDYLSVSYINGTVVAPVTATGNFLMFF